MWAQIIAAITAVGSSVIAGGMQIKENQRARGESSFLADRTRGDVLKQRTFDNQMTGRKLRFNDKKLDHDEYLTDESIASQERETSRLMGDRRKNLMTQSVQQLDETQEDLFAGRGIARRRFM